MLVSWSWHVYQSQFSYPFLLTPGSGCVPQVNRIVGWIGFTPYLARGAKLPRDISKIGIAILFMLFVLIHKKLTNIEPNGRLTAYFKDEN